MSCTFVVLLFSTLVAASSTSDGTESSITHGKLTDTQINIVCFLAVAVTLVFLCTPKYRQNRHYTMFILLFTSLAAMVYLKDIVDSPPLFFATLTIELAFSYFVTQLKFPMPNQEPCKMNPWCMLVIGLLTVLGTIFLTITLHLLGDSAKSIPAAAFLPSLGGSTLIVAYVYAGWVQGQHAVDVIRADEENQRDE